MWFNLSINLKLSEIYIKKIIVLVEFDVSLSTEPLILVLIKPTHRYLQYNWNGKDILSPLI